MDDNMENGNSTDNKADCKRSCQHFSCSSNTLKPWSDKGTIKSYRKATRDDRKSIV
jgi:hypothetical protein